MASPKAKLMGSSDIAARAPSMVRPAAGPVIAVLNGVDESGTVFATVTGLGVTSVRVSSHLDPAEVRRAAALRAAAVVLVDAARASPVLIGLVEERLRRVPPLPATEPVVPEPEERKPQATVLASVDARRVTITGDEEVVISCGKASIALTRDGNVVVKGARVETDADGVNRIKGASVRIN